MRSVLVCKNCRVPLVRQQKKYCAVCSPHIVRMNSYARFKTRKWHQVSKKCSLCGKLKPIAMFPAHRKRSGNGKIYIFSRSQCSACCSDTNGVHRGESRKRRRGLERTLTTAQWMETLSTLDRKCVYCGSPWEHLEHFVPLAKGGGHTVNNVLPSCAPCNISKANKIPFDFIRKLRLQNA